MTFQSRRNSLFALTLSLGLLAACEKGVLVRPNPQNPDFVVPTTAPAGTGSSKMEAPVEVGISLTHATLPAPEGVSANLVREEQQRLGTTPTENLPEKLWQGSVTLQITNSSLKSNHSYPLIIRAHHQAMTTGKASLQTGDPEITWKAICSGDNCGRLYVALFLHFDKAQLDTEKLKVLMVGLYREQNEVKRFLFNVEGDRPTRLSDLAKEMENMPAEKTRISLAETVKTPPTSGVAATAPSLPASSGVAASTGLPAPSGILPQAKTPQVDESAKVGQQDSVENKTTSPKTKEDVDVYENGEL